MKHLESSDTPICTPERDLLEMSSHARTLADFLGGVTLPFSLGIYGEWGSGKTSFVNLLVEFLKKQNSWQDCKLIYFSAWPYSNSDSVWRALLLQIAGKMYGVEESKEEVKNQQKKGLLPSLSNFLRSEVTLHRRTVPPTDDKEMYEALVRKLDISIVPLTNRSNVAEINQENAAFRIATLFLETASHFSSWVSMIRKLFGLEHSVKIGEDVRSHLGASKREVINSIEEIRNELRKMFEKNKEKRIVVFIDDLDRCMPDVALDLLEMIKIFFFESLGVRAQCFFIIAADQALIGQGLRFRYHLSEQGKLPADFQDLLHKKGQEYFEKIIQFGVTVPEKTVEQCQRLIATHFSLWSAATDILTTAIGTNPRRLQQNCNLISYKYKVYESKRNYD